MALATTSSSRTFAWLGTDKCTDAAPTDTGQRSVTDSPWRVRSSPRSDLATVSMTDILTAAHAVLVNLENKIAGH